MENIPKWRLIVEPVDDRTFEVSFEADREREVQSEAEAIRALEILLADQRQP